MNSIWILDLIEVERWRVCLRSGCVFGKPRNKSQFWFLCLTISRFRCINKTLCKFISFKCKNIWSIWILINSFSYTSDVILCALYVQAKSKKKKRKCVVERRMSLKGQLPSWDKCRTIQYVYLLLLCVVINVCEERRGKKDYCRWWWLHMFNVSSLALFDFELRFILHWFAGFWNKEEEEEND